MAVVLSYSKQLVHLIFSSTGGAKQIARAQLKPYTVSGFASIWQRKMKAAFEQGVIAERFTDHDLRAKSGSDTNFEHASTLLAHLDVRTTKRHYRRKVPVVRPLK